MSGGCESRVFPHGHRAIVMLPEDAGGLIVVRVAGANNMPAGRWGRVDGKHSGDSGNACAAYGPDCQAAVVILEKNVGAAVALKIVCTHHMPGGPDVRQSRDSKRCRPIHLPER